MRYSQTKPSSLNNFCLTSSNTISMSAPWITSGAQRIFATSKIKQAKPSLPIWVIHEPLAAVWSTNGGKLLSKSNLFHLITIPGIQRSLKGSRMQSLLQRDGTSLDRATEFTTTTMKKLIIAEMVA